MNRILLLENSMLMGKVTARRIETTQNMAEEVTLTLNPDDAMDAVAAGPPFSLAILSLDLSREKDMETLETISTKAPSVVIADTFSERTQEYVERKNVVDYIIRQGPATVDLVVEMVERLHKNRSTKIMVVDDSATSRAMIRSILVSHQFRVLEADNGKNAIELFQENPDVKLVITDYMMPVMDGFELLHHIREEMGKKKTELAVIGLSGHVANAFSARFIKNGGNDFLTKPFLKEEFICRVVQNVEYLENLSTIREMAEMDFLTGLYNRRHLFEIGDKFLSNALRKNITLTLAMIDIDHFKRVNDRYGHAAGDQVLRALGRLFRQCFREADMVARTGGEEFCVLAPNMSKDHVFTTFERFRDTVESTEVSVNALKLSITVSIGVVTCLCDTLDEMMQNADNLLYEAKAKGRNRLITDMQGPQGPQGPAT